MNLLSTVKLPLFSIAVFSLVSCDSDTPLAFGVPLDDPTEIDEFVEEGELFTFEATFQTNPEQVFDTIRITSQNIGESGGSTLGYTRTGLFNATLTADTVIVESLAEAVEQLFSVDNAANTEIRSLLLVTDPSLDAPALTSDELDRLVELLNTAGAGVARESAQSTDLVGIFDVVYTLTSTATQGERASGLVGGNYNIEASTQELAYDIDTLTDGEGNNFSFYFPILVGSVSDREVIEEGRYTLQLINEIGL